MQSISLILVAFLFSWPWQNAEWSDGDKENIRHFFTSMQADNAASSLSNNAGTEFAEAEFLKLKRLALAEARLVDDAVLAKAHRDLPERYRNLYQASIEYSIAAFENRDNTASIRASSLHDQWVDWYNAARRDIRIPK